MQSLPLWSASLGAPMPSWDKRHDHRHTLAIFRLALPLGGAGRVRGYVGAYRHDRFSPIFAGLRGYQGRLNLAHRPEHALLRALPHPARDAFRVARRRAVLLFLFIAP